MKSYKQTTKKLHPLKLIGQSLKQWSQNFNDYSKLVLVVAIPVAVLTILQADGNLGDFGLLMGFAFVFATISVIELGFSGNSLSDKKISTIYSAASARFLQFLGVSLLLILFSAPALAGLVAITSAVLEPNSSSIFLIILGLAGIMLSLTLLVRFSLAQALAVGKSRTVIESLKSSQMITKGNRLRIFFGFFVILTLSMVVLFGIQWIMGLNQSINENIYLNNLIRVLEVTLFLPVIFIYQIKLVKELNG